MLQSATAPMSAAACSAADFPRISAPAAPLVVRWINMAGQTTRARSMRRQIAAAQAVLPPGFAIDIERSEAVVPTCTRRSRPCAVPSPPSYFNSSEAFALEPSKLRGHTAQARARTSITSG